MMGGKSDRTVISDLLGFVYTFNCNAHCDFCCHPPEEYENGKMDPESVVSIIRQAAVTNSVTGIAFTGGEPFLYYDEIVDICTEVRAKGLPFRVVTNCYWSRSRDKAQEKLGVLKELGMNLLGVSCDHTHQQFVPLESVKNAIWAALDVGLEIEIVGTFWNAGSRVQDLIDLPENDPRIKVSKRLVLPAGRARKAIITPERYGMDLELSDFKCGGKNKYDVTVYPSGDVYPCCSGGCNIAAKLLMGNVKSTSLADILQRIHTNIFVRIAKEKSFQPLYDLVFVRDPQLYALLPEYRDKVSACQLCVEIHSNDFIMRKLAPYLEEYEITYALEELALWESLL